MCSNIDIIFPVLGHYFEAKKSTKSILIFLKMVAPTAGHLTSPEGFLSEVRVFQDLGSFVAKPIGYATWVIVLMDEPFVLVVS